MICVYDTVLRLHVGVFFVVAFEMCVIEEFRPCLTKPLLIMVGYIEDFIVERFSCCDSGIALLGIICCQAPPLSCA